MRKIDLIVIHASDSDVKKHDDIEVIRKWHVEERGWKDVGYHYFIKKDGTIQIGRLDKNTGAHVRHHNSNSIGICFSGRNDFTDNQFYSAKRLILGLMALYKLQITDILPHNELDNGKSCPNFAMERITKNLYTP